MANNITKINDGYVVVIGGMNMDIFGMPDKKVINRDSNPGVVGMAAGGVGQNIAHNIAKLDVPTYLITAYGNDYNGRLLQEECNKNNIRLDYASLEENERSSTYMYITDETGDMLVGVNDMDICKKITPDFLNTRLEFINHAQVCLLDANLQKETLDWIGKNVTSPLFGDTVSCAKAKHFSDILDKITLLKPNALEASLLTGIEIVDDETAKIAAQKLLDFGVKNVFISLGINGILCANNKKKVIIHPFVTDIVNANGAGDCGMAAITWSYFDDPTRHLGEVGRIAQAASSIALESSNSVPDININKLKNKLSSISIAV